MRRPVKCAYIPSVVFWSNSSLVSFKEPHDNMESLVAAPPLRSQRKRKHVSYSADGITTTPQDSVAQEKLLTVAQNAKTLVVFSGSGLSAGSGMSTFSTKGGLYERAQKRFAVADGKRLFTYSFYEKRKLETLAFFADIYAEARKAKPGPGHMALAQIAGANKLLRHYTMNIDGLAETAGMDAWHVENNPTGQTVEMHGNINQLVCPSCGVVVMMTPALLRKLKSKKAVPCTKCDCQAIRCRIMLYDDAEDDVITPEDVFDVMEEDVQKADLILWVGISFEQSASTAYFRRVRQYLMEANHLAVTPQAIVNITEEALWNLLSACSNTGSLDVLEVLSSSDSFLPLLAAAMTEAPALHQAEVHTAQQTAPQLLPVMTVAQSQQQQEQLASSSFPRAQQRQEQQLLNPKLATAQQQQQGEQSVTQPPPALQQQQLPATNAVPQPPDALQEDQRQQQKRVPRRRSPATEQHTLVPSQQQQQQHHMQTRRQLGHQVAQLQQLETHQRQPQVQSKLRHKLQQQLPKQRQRQKEQSVDGMPQAPQQQQLSATSATPHLPDARYQYQQSHNQQCCVDGQSQQQRPAHQVQGPQQGNDQQLHEQQQARQLQGQRLLTDQQQQQRQSQEPNLDTQQQVQQVHQGMHTAQMALHQQGSVQPLEQEHAPSQQHQALQAADNRQGALIQQGCQALTAAIKTPRSSQQQIIQRQTVQQPQEIQQPALALQAEPSEAELCLLKPALGQALSAACVPQSTLQQVASEPLPLHDQLEMPQHSYCQEASGPNLGAEPGLHLLCNSEGHALRLVEGELPPSAVRDTAEL